MDTAKFKPVLSLRQFSTLQYGLFEPCQYLRVRTGGGAHFIVCGVFADYTRVWSVVNIYP